MDDGVLSGKLFIKENVHPRVIRARVNGLPKDLSRQRALKLVHTGQGRGVHHHVNGLFECSSLYETALWICLLQSVSCAT